MHNPRPAVSRMAIVTCMLALTLSACQKSATTDNGQAATAPPIAALALATGAPPTPMAYAPPVAALPAPPQPVPLRLRHGRDLYGYTDRAYAMNEAFGQTPPDYTVDYDGTRPWVWRSDDGSYRVVEQLPNGERSYYYARGADRPFYITDPDGSYAFDGGQLVALYGPDGTPLSDAYAQQRAEIAARYYNRSAAVYHAVQYSSRQAAYADNWRARREALAQQQQNWDATRARDADWQTWHDQHQQDEAHNWQAEQDRRAAYAVAIGAAAVGVATLISRHHDDGGQYRSGPPAPNNSAVPQDGYGQRPYANGPQGGNGYAPQQQAHPATQPSGGHPTPQQVPAPPGVQHPHPQSAHPMTPARAPMPAREGAAVNRPLAPAAMHGPAVMPNHPEVRAPAEMRPRAPSPIMSERPLAPPRPPEIRRPVEPIAAPRMPINRPAIVRPAPAPIAARMPEHRLEEPVRPPVPAVTVHREPMASDRPVPRAPAHIVPGEHPHGRTKPDGQPQN